MRRLRFTMRLAGAGVVPLLVAGTLSAGTTASAAPARGGSTARAGFTVTGQLHGVAALSASDAWAVGYSCVSSCGRASESDDTVIAHWNGSAWKRVSSPNPGVRGSGLYGVAAISASDAWAVGSTTVSGGSYTTLVLHWNGMSWKRVPSPGGDHCSLENVTALSAGNAWAVGGCWRRGRPHAGMIEHWNGTAWKQVTSSANASVLYSVAATSARNIWAAGWGHTGTMIEHWNGTAWKQVASPGKFGFSSVAATSASNAWAVGETGSQKTLMARWNGTSWKHVTGPDSSYYLLGVAATSASNAWAAGYYCAAKCASGPAVDHTVIVHWNGTAWKRMTSPSPGAIWNTLFGVAADSASDAWAVGWYCAAKCASISEVDHTLITHWNGTAWK